MSLVELLIGFGVATVLAVGLGRMVTDTLMVGKTAATRSDFSVFRDSVRMAMSSSSVCAQLFRSATPAGVGTPDLTFLHSAATPTDVKILYSGGVLAEKNKVLGGTNYKVNAIRLKSQLTGTQTPDAITIGGVNALQGPAQLEFDLAMTGGAGATQMMSRGPDPVPVMITTNASTGAIIACGSQVDRVCPPGQLLGKSPTAAVTDPMTCVTMQEMVRREDDASCESGDHLELVTVSGVDRWVCRPEKIAIGETNTPVPGSLSDVFIPGLLAEVLYDKYYLVEMEFTFLVTANNTDLSVFYCHSIQDNSGCTGVPVSTNYGRINWTITQGNNNLFSVVTNSNVYAWNSNVVSPVTKTFDKTPGDLVTFRGSGYFHPLAPSFPASLANLKFLRLLVRSNQNGFLTGSWMKIRQVK